MKTNIITFHNTSNFGATLQCAALQVFLEKNGAEVQVVNYLPDYVLDKKSIFREFRRIGSSGNKAKALVKGLLYLSFSPEIKKRDRCFEEFIDRVIHLTRAYHTPEELMDNPPEADLYICGSDQIWNPTLTGGKLDSAFFLQFVPKTACAVKASYGASIGELDIECCAEELRSLTNDFTAVSVREKSIADRMSETLGHQVKTVLDPTLLLNAEDYAPMEDPFGKGKSGYVLIYNVQNSTASCSAARKIASEKGLKIIDISPNPFSKINCAEKITDIGPGQFLSLIKNAEYIVTNSFHGTAFSVIYRKQFYTFAHSTRAGRTVDLLNSLKLESRFLLSEDDINLEKTIDYNAVTPVLDALKKESSDYLKNLLTV